MKKGYALVQLVMATLVVAACAPSREIREEEFTVTAYRYDAVLILFPESDFTEEFILYLPENYNEGLGTDKWYEKVADAVYDLYLIEHGIRKYSSRFYAVSYAKPFDPDPGKYIKILPNDHWIRHMVTVTSSQSYWVVFSDLPENGNLSIEWYFGDKSMLSADYLGEIWVFPERPREILANPRVSIVDLHALEKSQLKIDETVLITKLDYFARTEASEVVYIYEGGDEYFEVALPEELTSLALALAENDEVDFKSKEFKMRAVIESTK